MSDETPLRSSRTVLVALAIATAYYLAARLGFVLRFPPATTSVVWPPNALLTATLLLLPATRWWLCVAAAFPAHLLVEIQAGLPPSLVLALFVTNCSEALIAAALLRRWSDAPTRFDSLRRVTAFLIAAVLLAPLLSSFADAAAVHALRGEPYWPVLRRRFFSNALSALTFIPSVLVVVTQAGSWVRESSGWRRLEAILLTVALFAVGQAVFSGRVVHASELPGVPYTTLPFLIPVLMMAAVRFGPAGASLALLATFLLAIRAAILGWRPFVPLTPEESVAALQVFAAVVGVPLLFVSALIEERRQVTADLAERLRFEELLSRLSGEFVHLASPRMDQAFEAGLERIGTFFGVQRVALRLFSPNAQDLTVAYGWAPSGNPLPATWRRSEIPWVAERLLREEAVVVSVPDDLPAEAAAEQELMARHGIRSFLVLPLVGGGEVLGCLSLIATSEERTWPRQVVERSALIADLLASAMARKKAEHAVRKSDATKAGILDSLASRVAVLDRSGRIVTVNERWREADGRDPGAEAFDTVGGDYLEPWRRRAAEGGVQAALIAAGIGGVLDGALQSFAQEYPSPDDPERWHLMTVVPLQASEGGAVLSLSEVTERKRAEVEAQRSRQELAHFLRVSTIGELTTSLAHELNQPLTAILANAQAAARLVRDGPNPDLSELGSILRDIVEDDRRAGEVIGRLRNLLRKGEIERAQLEVNGLVREVVALVASDAVIRGLTVRLELHPRPLMVRGDRVQIQQVLLNLLINAMEAMAEQEGPGSPIRVWTEAPEGNVRICVADAGPGLPAGGLGRVFEPFFTTKPGGLGMGLSIARSILDAHHGSIGASNNPSRGATFTVTLPATEH